MEISVTTEVKELSKEMQKKLTAEYGDIPAGSYIKQYADAETGEAHSAVFNKDGKRLPKKVATASKSVKQMIR